MPQVGKDGTHSLAVDHGTTHTAVLHRLADIEKRPAAVLTVPPHSGEADILEVGAAVQREGMVGEGDPGLGLGLVIAGGPGLVIVEGPDLDPGPVTAGGPGLRIAGGPGLGIAGGPGLRIAGSLGPDPGLVIAGGPDLDPGLVVAGGLGLAIEGGQDRPQGPDVVTVVPGLVLVQEVASVTDAHAQYLTLATGEEGVGDHRRGTGGEAIAPVHVPGIATDLSPLPHVLVTG